MLAAHLRGLLQSSYPAGIVSVAAESMVLEALELEGVADMRFKRMLLDGQFASFFDPKKVTMVMQENLRMFKKVCQAQSLDAMGTLPAEAKGSVDDIRRIYQALSESGLIKQQEEIL